MSSGKKVGVILSGCGFLDGAEIHEAVLTLLALDRLGADIQCAAPNKAQADVMNHAAGAPGEGGRNVLEESARIARGVIGDIKDMRGGDLDAVVVPGGYGAAKNLCSFASAGSDCTADPEVERVLREAHAAGKPIGAMCIAPALVARVFGKDLSPQLTIGSDAGTAQALEAMGASHADCAVDDVVVDEKNRIVTTPAYMLAKRISEAAAGIDKLCATVYEMA